MRVVDVGCGTLGLRASSRPGRHRRRLVAPGRYPGPFVQADAAERLPFADGEFDLAYARR